MDWYTSTPQISYSNILVLNRFVEGQQKVKYSEVNGSLNLPHKINISLFVVNFVYYHSTTFLERSVPGSILKCCPELQ